MCAALGISRLAALRLVARVPAAWARSADALAVKMDPLATKLKARIAEGACPCAAAAALAAGRPPSAIHCSAQTAPGKCTDSFEGLASTSPS